MDEEKFIQRVEMMLYHTCGCSFEEGIIILEKCLERAKRNKEEIKKHMRNALNKLNELDSINSWANYVRTHKDEEWSKRQNRIIDSELKKLKN